MTDHRTARNLFDAGREDAARELAFELATIYDDATRAAIARSFTDRAMVTATVEWLDRLGVSFAELELEVDNAAQYLDARGLDPRDAGYMTPGALLGAMALAAVPWLVLAMIARILFF